MYKPQGPGETALAKSVLVLYMLISILLFALQFHCADEPNTGTLSSITTTLCIHSTPRMDRMTQDKQKLLIAAGIGAALVGIATIWYFSSSSDSKAEFDHERQVRCRFARVDPQQIVQTYSYNVKDVRRASLSIW